MGRFSPLLRAEKLSKISSASGLDSWADEVFAVALTVPSRKRVAKAMAALSATITAYGTRMLTVLPCGGGKVIHLAQPETLTLLRISRGLE